MSNKVVLIGGNHHNGLGLAREFGRHSVRPYGFIVSEDSRRSFLRKSKYWERTWACDSDAQAIALIKEFFGDEEEPAILIPWSDGAAEAIDLQLDVLSERFIVPSVDGRQGEIARLMDKLAQLELGERFGLKMLPSEIIDLTHESVLPSLPLPMILKPVASVEGGKSDMVICLNSSELALALDELKRKGFSRILAQCYMPMRREYALTGAISPVRTSFSVARHIRQWPPDFGTGSFSDFAISEKVTGYCAKVLNALKGIGYSGPIDIEFFEDLTGELFLNEVNWRSSGRNFVSQFTGVPSAFMWYCDVTGKKYDAVLFNERRGFSMNEVTDPRHVLKGEISLFEWLRDVRRTDSFSVWSSDDPAPAFARYVQLLRKALRKRGRV